MVDMMDLEDDVRKELLQMTPKELADVCNRGGAARGGGERRGGKERRLIELFAGSSILQSLPQH